MKPLIALLLPIVAIAKEPPSEHSGRYYQAEENAAKEEQE